MPYNYSAEKLFGVIHEKAPALANALSDSYRNVNQGLLSVGLKLHCVGPGREFTKLTERLGGAEKIMWNGYRQVGASLCFVLPPVGNAESAIKMIEAIEHFNDRSIFGNSQIQIQVCSPGRLDGPRSAILGVGFYLGSDKIRKLKLHEVTTTFSENGSKYTRGRRIVLWDAQGEFDDRFTYWGKIGNTRFLEERLPFSKERTDILTGLGYGSRIDIRNVNFMATLLMHAQSGGYWEAHGKAFEADMRKMLDDHGLTYILGVPWIHTNADSPESGDEMFHVAYNELVDYAFQEASRLAWQRNSILGLRRNKSLDQSSILGSMQSILKKYRRIIGTESQRFDNGGEQ